MNVDYNNYRLITGGLILNSQDDLMGRFARAVEALFPPYRSATTGLFALDGLGRKPMQECLVGTIGDD